LTHVPSICVQRILCLKKLFKKYSFVFQTIQRISKFSALFAHKRFVIFFHDAISGKTESEF